MTTDALKRLGVHLAECDGKPEDGWLAACRAAVRAAVVEAPQRLWEWGLRARQEVLSAVGATLETWLATADATHGVCGLRLAIGVAKRCTQLSCTVSAIGAALRDATTWFAEDGGVCWQDHHYRIDARDLDLLVDLATRASEILRGPAASDWKAGLRAIAAWARDAAALLARGTDTSPGFEVFEDALVALLDEDYVRAATAVLQMVKAGHPKLTLPTGVLRLLGAVASYAHTYSESAKLDPKEARAARKEALEALIDSATERHERYGDWVVSLGIPVGYSVGSLTTHEPARTLPSRGDAKTSAELAAQLRLPLGFYLQRLPTRNCIAGFHLGMWVADLGQFLRAGAQGEEETIRWSDFVGLGGEVGVLLGSPSTAFRIGAEVAWSPGLYRRTYTIAASDDAEPSTETLAGGFFVGVTLGFYVPLFDLD